MPRGAAFFLVCPSVPSSNRHTLINMTALESRGFFFIVEVKSEYFYLMIRCHCELMFGPFVGMILQEHMEGN